MDKSGEESARPSGNRGSRTIEHAASRWLARRSLHELDDRDRAAFEGWLAADPAHAATYARMESALAQTDGAGDVARTADRRARSYARLHTVRGTGAALGVVCALLTGLVATTDFAVEFADVRTARAEQKVLQLADGSRLTIDADSAVDIDYGPSRRTVRLLHGRAHAEVRHGDNRPFRLLARSGEVRDIGTGFEVAIGGERVTATVTDGIVLAGNANGRFRLTAGQGVEWRGETAPRRFMTTAESGTASWRYGRLVFDQRPLGDVLQELDRYSSRPIWLLDKAAAGRRVSGVVTATAIDASLPSLARSQGLRVRDAGVVLLVY